MNRISTSITYMALCILLLGAIGCKLISTSSPSPKPMEMKPYQEPSYTQSLPLTPRKALLKALDKAGKGERIVKIPVVLRLNADGMRHWEEAFLGSDETIANEEKIHVRLNDSHLGVSLADRIHQYCPQGEWCKLWLTGYWAQDLTAIEPSKPDPNSFPFGIRAVLGQQADGDQTLVYFAAE